MLEGMMGKRGGGSKEAREGQGSALSGLAIWTGMGPWTVKQKMNSGAKH